MSGKITNFTLERMTEAVSLFDSHFHGDNNVTEDFGTIGGIGVIFAVFAHGERKNICHLVDISVNGVDFPDLFVIDESNADFNGTFKIFHFKNGITAASDKHSETCGDFDIFLFVSDNNLDFIHN